MTSFDPFFMFYCSAPPLLSIVFDFSISPYFVVGSSISRMLNVKDFGERVKILANPLNPRYCLCKLKDLHYECKAYTNNRPRMAKVDYVSQNNNLHFKQEAYPKDMEQRHTVACPLTPNPKSNIKQGSPNGHQLSKDSHESRAEQKGNQSKARF